MKTWIVRNVLLEPAEYRLKCFLFSLFLGGIQQTLFQQ